MAPHVRGKGWWGSVLTVVAAAGVFGLGVWSGSAAEESPSKSSRSSRASSATKAQEDGSEIAGLEKKLDEILANQQTILSKFDAIMEELRIIKVRATIRSGS